MMDLLEIIVIDKRVYDRTVILAEVLGLFALSTISLDLPDHHQQTEV